MSTRCHIIIKKNNDEAFVYRHHDGYPDGAGEDLQAFINNNKDNIDNWSCNDFAAKLSKWDYEFEFENRGIHGDEDYIYIIDLDIKFIGCYKVPNSMEATYDVDKLEKIYINGFQN